MATISATATTVTISLTGSLADWNRVVNALSVRYGYQATLPSGQSNPKTAPQFVLDLISGWASSETAAHELSTQKAAITVTPPVLS